MQKERTTGKNWLQLNIEDSSSSESQGEQQTTAENFNQQKTIHIKPCKLPYQQHYYNLPTPSRDAFRATRVQRGFFMDDNNNDMEQYDNFEIKQIKMQKIQHNEPIVVKVNNNKKESVRAEGEQQTPSTKQLSEQQDEHINNPCPTTQTNVQKLQFQQLKQQQQSNNNTKKKTKMFQLHFSDSQQSDIPNSQGDEKVKQLQKQKIQYSTLSLSQNETNHCSQRKDNYYTTIPNNYKKNFQFTYQPQHHVLNQISKDERIRTIITRSSSGLNKLWPQFEVKLQSTGLNLLLVKKQTFTIGSTYKIYSKLINTEKRYFGRIQSNLSKDFYKIFTSDNGFTDNLKAEIYFKNVLTGNNQPRQFTVYMLTAESKFGELAGGSVKENMTLREYFEFAQNQDKIKKFATRKAIYNQKMGGYMLNFNQRIKKPSIKNFILEDQQTQQEILMFGRLEKQNFRLQISHPLNCVIGTAIVMVEFQSRLME